VDKRLKSARPRGAPPIEDVGMFKLTRAVILVTLCALCALIADASITAMIVLYRDAGPPW
jgi:hypothetical protein